MKTFSTEYIDGKGRKIQGPDIYANTLEEAIKISKDMFGTNIIVGQLVAENKRKHPIHPSFTRRYLENLCKQHPNDQELGKKVRELFA